MFYGWIIVAVTAVTLLFSFGYNVSIGAFFGSFSKEFGWSHTLLASAVSLNMLTWGFLQPIMGKLADKFGPRKIIVFGVVLMGTSMLLCSTISSLWQLYLYYGILTAVGFSAAGSLVNSVLITRWFRKKKGTAMGLSTVGINAGQLIVLLSVGYFLFTKGWETTFIIMGIVMLLVVTPLVWFAAKDHPGLAGQRPDGEQAGEGIQNPAPATKGYSWNEAVRTRHFWLLATSFMGCGFTLYLMVAHLPSFAVDLGASKQLAASLLGIAGGASIFGTVIMGSLSDRIGQRVPLLITHLLRAVSFFLFYKATTVTMLQWDMLLYGFASFAIIPLVTSYAAGRFGTASIGQIMGSVWLLHQISAALGVFLGGWIRDMTGSYHTVYLIGTIVLMVSTVLAFGLTEEKRTEMKPTHSTI